MLNKQLQTDVCFRFQTTPPGWSCPTWRTTHAPTTSTLATYLYACAHTHKYKHTHTHLHTPHLHVLTVPPGQQLPPGVHRHPRAAARHEGRFLEDGVGAWRAQRRHGDAVCGEGTGKNRPTEIRSSGLLFWSHSSSSYYSKIPLRFKSGQLAQNVFLPLNFPLISIQRLFI